MQYVFYILEVVPLRSGIAFKKAFSDPLTFHALVKAALGLDFKPTRVEQEYSYPEAVARIHVAYDLFAEDKQTRTIVELQHVREEASYDRFLYYHCLGLAEQIVSSENYRLERHVYTLVLLTRWPKEERLQYGRAICDLDPVTEEGAKLEVYRHRLVFVNVKAPPERLPPELRPLVALMEDTLDGQVDERRHPDAISQRILGQIARTRLSPEENAELKAEASWEAAKQEERDEGFDEGKKLGLDEGEKLGFDRARRLSLQQAIVDLCEVCGIELSTTQRSKLETLNVADLEERRIYLKTHRIWPP